MIKKWLLVIGFLIMGIIWLAYTSKSVPNGAGPKKFIGSSDNWKAVLEIKDDNDRQYAISHIGEGKKPSDFTYEIHDSPYELEQLSGEGSLEDQEEVWIGIRCTPPCAPPTKTISVTIKWDGKEKNLI